VEQFYDIADGRYYDLPLADDDYEHPLADEEDYEQEVVETESDEATESDLGGEDSESETEAQGKTFAGLTWGTKKKLRQFDKARNTKGQNGGGPNFKKDYYDHVYWTCTLVGAGKQFVELLVNKCGTKYVVPKSRVNKALRYLHLPTVADLLRPGTGICRCKRAPECYMRGLTAHAILDLRLSFFQQLNEVGATKYLADVVRPYNPTTKGKTTKRKFTLKWMVGGVQCCDDFFRAVFGVSKNKLKGVRQLLKGAGTLPAPRVVAERPKVKFNQCKGFWRAFFETCQRPNDQIRLFPVNASYPFIYEEHFQTWFKQALPESDLPYMGWFMAARHDEEFSDVKNRAKHHHCRCLECANLQARRLKAFNTAFDQAEFKREWQDHQNEKRDWRDFEKSCVLAAKHDPKNKNCYWFDDTEKLGLPKFSKRPPKNLTTSRFDVIPFLIADLARGKDFYIYTAKGRFKKGGNRLCTSLLATFRATKEGPGPARHARHLTLIADNFAENKNNTVFAFCSHLVMIGWYDVIELVYGPPGHTHNGGDQQHRIHNEVCGNFTSVTFAHFIARYPQAWRQEGTRPTACILDVQYDWDAYYKSHLNPLGGFTKTVSDPVACRGFQFSRDKNGIVGMKWKTKAESGDWRGADSHVGTEGFVVLKSRPRGAPATVEPERHLMEKKHFKQLTGAKMQTCLDAEGEGAEAMEWLTKAAQHGVIPVHQRLQTAADITPGEFGAKVELKCGGVTAVVQLIEEGAVTDAKFWDLPAEVERVLREGRRNDDVLSERHRRHPAIGYKATPVRKRSTYPGSGAQKVVRDKEAEQKQPIEPGDGESDTSGSEEIIVNNANRSASSPERARKRQRVPVEAESAVEITTKHHDIKVVFGERDGVRELWFGIRIGRSKSKKVKVQFLQAEPSSKEEGEARGRLYILTGEVATYDEALIKHTFKDVEFVETTTYKLTTKGCRYKRAPDVKNVTKEPLDATVLSSLSAQCDEFSEPSSDSSSNST